MGAVIHPVTQRSRGGYSAGATRPPGQPGQLELSYFQMDMELSSGPRLSLHLSPFCAQMSCCRGIEEMRYGSVGPDVAHPYQPPFALSVTPYSSYHLLTSLLGSSFGSSIHR